MFFLIKQILFSKTVKSTKKLHVLNWKNHFCLTDYDFHLKFVLIESEFALIDVEWEGCDHDSVTLKIDGKQ